MNTARRWATEVWGGEAFTHRSTVKGQQTVLARMVSSNVQLQVMEQGGTWQELAPGTMADKLVPTINWLTLPIHQQTLVTIKQSGTRFLRLLVTTDAPVSYNDAGQVRLSGSQTNYMMIERVKVLVGCDAYEAKQLKIAIKDPLSLQIFSLAAHLLKSYNNQLQQAKDSLTLLWSLAPEQICSVIPPQFHILANTNRHQQIGFALQKSLRIMGSWQTR